MDYDVKLSILYEYDSPAVGLRYLVCLTPIPSGDSQQVLFARLEIDPVPQERADRSDFFGNQLTEFSYSQPHDRIELTMQAQVSRYGDLAPLQGQVGLADLPGILAQWRDMGPASPLHFLAVSSRVPQDAGITGFAQPFAHAAIGVADVVENLGQALYDAMQFDATATTVDTPAHVAFAQRRGVCQDFSHIMIAALRSLGIPAGYVSGYLRTLPPPGKPRLEGADAMHAWVRAWCGPQVGWMDYDPTNACRAGGDHIFVAWGRDYADVAPIRGAMRIAGGQNSTQAVDVVERSGA